MGAVSTVVVAGAVVVVAGAVVVVAGAVVSTALVVAGFAGGDFLRATVTGGSVVAVTDSSAGG